MNYYENETPAYASSHGKNHGLARRALKHLLVFACIYLAIQIIGLLISVPILSIMMTAIHPDDSSSAAVPFLITALGGLLLTFIPALIYAATITVIVRFTRNHSPILLHAIALVLTISFFIAGMLVLSDGPHLKSRDVLFFLPCLVAAIIAGFVGTEVARRLAAHSELDRGSQSGLNSASH
jgi:hypothetical protein